MANAAATLKEHSRLPRVVWRTLTDKALHCRSNTSSLWLRLTELYAETSSFGLIHVNSADTHIKIDLEGLRLHDDFDVSLVVCHNAAPFEEQSDGERHLLR